MKKMRRFLCSLLVLAIAHYGVLAAGIAHAHDHGDSHELPVVAGTGLQNHGFHAHGFHEHDHQTAYDVSDQAPDEDGGTQEPTLHVHSAAPFAPVQHISGLMPPLQASAMRMAASQSLSPTPPAPLFKPPRALL